MSMAHMIQVAPSSLPNSRQIFYPSTNTTIHNNYHNQEEHSSKTTNMYPQHEKKSSSTFPSLSTPALSHVTLSKDSTTMTPIAIRVYTSEEEHSSSSAASFSSPSSVNNNNISGVYQSDLPCSKSTNSSSSSSCSPKTTSKRKSKSSKSKLSNNEGICNSTATTKISKYACQKSKKKSKIKIPVFELIRVMALPQTSAAQVLGVSLSTLKRRYYELGIGRWPGQIANNPKEIEKAIECAPEEKVKLDFLLNEEDIDARQIDQITWSILNFTFKQTF